MALSKSLCDFLIYVEHNPKLALELAAVATKNSNFKDWWWKARLGKCYYQLGLYRDAEKQFSSSLRDQNMVVTSLELGKTYIRLDQPNAALDTYTKGASVHGADISLTLRTARIHDMLNNIDRGVAYYEKVLDLDSSNIEAISCLASNYFYDDQPEIALRLFRRLLQMGVNNTEIWCNLGLCCFYSSQYDMSLNCFQRALQLADDDNMADVWYNIGQIGISIGDLGLAYETFKIAISCDSNHAESYNNLGVLELKRGNVVDAKTNFETAASLGPYMHEPLFNAALLSFRTANFQDSYKLAQAILEIYPGHTETEDLLKKLQEKFSG